MLYPGGANIPQAWAAGSIFMMVQTMLGLRADAPHRRLYVNPTLPDWLQEVEVGHLRWHRCVTRRLADRATVGAPKVLKDACPQPIEESL